MTNERLNVAVDESIMAKDMPATASSKMLENFVAPFDATVITKLKDSGINIVKRTKSDEFGIGNYFNAQNCGQPAESETKAGGETTDELQTINSKDTLHQHKSEAIELVKNGTCNAVLINDYSGTMRRLAAANGLYYIHPTYGTVSRFGLIAAVSSMDQIGVLCKNINDGIHVLSAISGHDKNDGTTYPAESYDYKTATVNTTTANTATANTTGQAQGQRLKAGIPVNVLNSADASCKNAIYKFAEEHGLEPIEFDIKYYDVLAQVQYILSCAEISNNINRFDGIKFGYRTQNYTGLNDLYLNTRTEAFGLNTKLAAIMGAMVLSKNHYEPLYNKAMQIRRLVCEAAATYFSKYDLILLPSSLGNDSDLYQESALYALATLCGLPSVSAPGGIQLVSSLKNEALLFCVLKHAQGGNF